MKSPSTAMADIYRKERPALAEYTGSSARWINRSARVFVINGRIAGMDSSASRRPSKCSASLSKAMPWTAINTGEEALRLDSDSYERPCVS